MKAIFLLFLLPLRLFSQDLSGIWVGTIATSGTQIPFELAINPDLTGYSMMTFIFKGAEKIAVKRITLIRKDSTYTISDDKLIYNNFEMKSRNIKTYCELSIKIVDTTMVLSGPFHTRTRDLKAGDEDLSTGTITLQKQNIKAQTRLIGKLDSLKLSNTLTFSNPKPDAKESPAVAASEKAAPAPAASQKAAPPVAASEKAAPQVAAPEKAAPGVAESKKEAPAVARTPEKQAPATKQQPNNVTTASAPPPPPPPKPKIIAAAADIASRKTVVIREIDFKSDSLTFSLFDNGIVDGDTVSVVLNGQVIIPKLGLTEKAYRKVIQIPPGMGDSLQLVMYAENLGTIPPNSGLLIIEDGPNRYEVGFEGDMKKSSAVTLRRMR